MLRQSCLAVGDLFVLKSQALTLR